MEDLKNLSVTSLSLHALSGGISSIFGNNGNDEGIVKLLGLQMQMLNNIGDKIDVIQEQLDVIYDTLEKIAENQESLPAKVVAELYKKDIKSILILIKEKNKAFVIDYTKDSSLALGNYEGIFREILPILQVARIKLFFMEDEYTLPVICSCLYFELICMRIANEPATLFDVVLDSYKDWITKCLDGSLYLKLTDARNNNRLNIEKASAIFCYNFSFDKEIDEIKEREVEKPGGRLVTEHYHVTNSVFEVKQYSCKLEPIDALKNDAATDLLVQRNIIEAVEIPGKLTVDALYATTTDIVNLENKEHITTTKPINIGGNWFNISLKELADSVKKEESNFINNPVKFRLIETEGGYIEGPFNKKFIEEEKSLNDAISKTGYDLLKYASLINIGKTTLADIDRFLLSYSNVDSLLFYQAEADKISGLCNPLVQELIEALDQKANQIDLIGEKDKILEIRKKMTSLKGNSAALLSDYKGLEEEVLAQLADDQFAQIIDLVQNIGREIEKGVQNIDREGKKFENDLAQNLKKAFEDIEQQLKRDTGNLVDAGGAIVDFVGNQIESYGESLSHAEKRIREGKIIDAIWHSLTEPIQSTDDNFAEMVQDSSLMNTIAASVCSIYGGPAGAAAYAAWYTYKLTNDLNLALKNGIITGLTSYATGAVNGTKGVPLAQEELLKRSIATSAIGAIAIAASGGDEKAIMEGFLKGVALSVASNTYKSVTGEEIEGKAPTKAPSLKLKLDYTEDKYLVLRDSAGKDLFKTIYNEDLGEYNIIPNDGAQIMTLQELGREVSMVGIASASDNGSQVFTETAIPMKLLATAPYINDMAYFHDIWCDKMIASGYDLNAGGIALTILPATVLTVAGSPTPLLTQISDVINQQPKKEEDTP